MKKNNFFYWGPVFLLSPLIPVGVIVALPAIFLLWIGDDSNKTFSKYRKKRKTRESS